MICSCCNGANTKHSFVLPLFLLSAFAYLLSFTCQFASILDYRFSPKIRVNTLNNQTTAAFSKDIPLHGTLKIDGILNFSFDFSTHASHLVISSEFACDKIIAVGFLLPFTLFERKSNVHKCLLL